MSIDEFPRELGRYLLYDPIASGGMAAVHFGRLHGAVGFSRLVAIKRLRPNYAGDAEFVRMFLDEARLAARLDHPNVVSTLDVVANESEVFIVMEHVLGETLDQLMRLARQRMPPAIVSAIVCGILEGLHAAHEARGDTGEPLEIVHRDVSPHNVIVSVDGRARLFDFGVAKAASNTHETRAGVVKGKVTYMAPEQVRGAADRRADLYATGVILWELLAGRRRHAGEQNDAIFLKLAMGDVAPPPPLDALRDDVPPDIDAIVARATALSPEDRYTSAREMAVAVEAAIAPAPPREVARWLREIAGRRIEEVSAVMRRIEQDLPSESSLSIATGGATGSVHAMTATIRPDTTSSGVQPAEPARASAPPPRSRSRKAAAAAAIALAAVALVVGARALPRGAPAEPVGTRPPAAASLPERASEERATGERDERADANEPLAARPTTAEATPDAGRTTPPPTQRPRPAARAPYGGPAARPVAHAPPPRRDPAPAPAARSEPAPVSATKGGCENPFSIGADGIRQIKPECM